MGTVAYAAPEQLEEGGHLSPASDQYALAVMVYQWLTGELPFNGSFLEIAYQKLNQEPSSPGDKVPDLSSEIAYVVRMGLQRDPKNRYKTVQHFANALAKAAKIPTPLGAVTPNLRRQQLSRRAVAVGACGLVIASLLGGFWWGQSATHALTYSPTDAPNLQLTGQNSGGSPFAAGETWEGQAHQYDQGGVRFGMVLTVTTLQEATFSGNINWPSLNNSLTSFDGNVVIDFADPNERQRWQSVIGFSENVQGTWIRFTENKLVQGSGVEIGLHYYALVHHDGAVNGVWFRADSVIPSGDFLLDQKL